MSISVAQVFEQANACACQGIVFDNNVCAVAAVLVPCKCVCVCTRERERKREREKERVCVRVIHGHGQTSTHTHRHTHGHRHTHTDTDTHIHTHRHRHTHTHTPQRLPAGRVLARSRHRRQSRMQVVQQRGKNLQAQLPSPCQATASKANDSVSKR